MAANLVWFNGPHKGRLRPLLPLEREGTWRVLPIHQNKLHWIKTMGKCAPLRQLRKGVDFPAIGRKGPQTARYMG